VGRKITAILKDADDVCKLITGQRINHIIARTIDLMQSQPGEPSPYQTLGVRPDAGDVVIKVSYRALMREMEGKPESQKILMEAYAKITEERKWNR
jgi:hypothetical protein